MSKVTFVFYLFIISLLIPGITQAFKPTAEFGHVGIVDDAASTISRASSDGSETFMFSEKAILEIRDSTAGVDEIFSSRGELSVPLAHCDDELLPECTSRINSIKSTVIALLARSSPDGGGARAQVGRALHTLQDFYSHSNWINVNGAVLSPAIGISTIGRLTISQQTCEKGFSSLGSGTLSDFGLTNITTGYFSLFFAPPNGKCNHGLGLDPGIHKDAPGRLGHEAARQAAVLSTRNFIEQILDADGISGNDKAIRAFMDVKGALGFIIDDTGSMGSVINGVKSSVAQIVNLVASSDDAPEKYILVNFGDPSVSAAFVTDNASSLLSRVNGLRARGGGDCPELSMQGALNAVNAAPTGSQLYLFTDASSKDAYLASNVTATAREKDISLNVLSFGSCSPIDPAYFAISRETGGQLFSLNRSFTETQKIFSLINPIVTGDPSPVLLNKGVIATGSQIFTVPVDNSISSVTFSVSTSSLNNVQLVRPDGTAVTSDFSTEITTLSGGKIIRINNPLTGNYQLSINGSGNYDVAVSGDSPISFHRFNFVELRGRAGHEGLFPIKGEPVVGKMFTGMANLIGGLSDSLFELTSEDGVLIQSISLIHDVTDNPPGEFVGKFSLPDQSFRIKFSSVDSDGNTILRIYPAVITGQTVSVEALGDGVSQILAGKASLQRFKISNFGLNDTFTLIATDGKGFVSSVNPESVNLSQNESQVIDVEIIAPASTPAGTTNTITLVAKGLSTENNTILTQLVVEEAARGDLDRDGDIDRDDVAVVLESKNTLASSDADPRDIDGDGRITALDARKLSRMCTRPRCAR